jgi:predicted nucleotidyltransferase component of viral defense system
MHQEAVWSAARPILSKLANFKYSERFYLVGGTALALQLGHRVSVDLDWFSQKPLPKDLLPQLKKFFAGSRMMINVDNGEELTMAVDGVKITFFHYPFPSVGKLLNGDGFKMASIEEIAVMKAHTIGRRSKFRDYADMYFILKNGISLATIIKKAVVCFGDEFDPRLFLEQLVYLKDLEEGGVQFLGKPVSKREVQIFFEKEVEKMKI